MTKAMLAILLALTFFVGSTPAAMAQSLCSDVFLHAPSVKKPSTSLDNISTQLQKAILQSSKEESQAAIKQSVDQLRIITVSPGKNQTEALKSFVASKYPGQQVEFRAPEAPGASSNQVVVAFINGSPELVLKVYRGSLKEFAQELVSLKTIRDVKPETFSVTEPVEAFQLQKEGVRIPVLVMKMAPGEAAGKRFHRLLTSKDPESLSQAKITSQEIGTALGELHLKFTRASSTAHSAQEFKTYQTTKARAELADVLNNTEFLRRGWITNAELATLQDKGAALIQKFELQTEKYTTLTHGDLHSGNVLVGKGKPTFIDNGSATYVMKLDADKKIVALGDPAADIGRFLESLAMENAIGSGIKEKVEALEQSFLTSYQQAARTRLPELQNQIAYHRFRFDLKYLTKDSVVSLERQQKALDFMLKRLGLRSESNADRPMNPMAEAFAKLVPKKPLNSEPRALKEVGETILDYSSPFLIATTQKALQNAPESVKKSIVEVFNNFNSYKFENFLSKVIKDLEKLCKPADQCQESGIPLTHLEAYFQVKAKELEIPFLIIKPEDGRIENLKFMTDTMGGGALVVDHGSPLSHGEYSHGLQNLFVYETLGAERGKEMYRYFETGAHDPTGKDFVKQGPIFLYNYIFDVRAFGTPVKSPQDIAYLLANAEINGHKVFRTENSAERVEITQTLFAEETRGVNLANKMRASVAGKPQTTIPTGLNYKIKRLSSIELEKELLELGPTTQKRSASGRRYTFSSNPYWKAYRNDTGSVAKVHLTKKEAQGDFKNMIESIKKEMRSEGLEPEILESRLAEINSSGLVKIAEIKDENGNILGYQAQHDIGRIEYDFLPWGYKLVDSPFVRNVKIYRDLGIGKRSQITTKDILDFLRQVHITRIEEKPHEMLKAFHPDILPESFSKMTLQQKASLFDALDPAKKFLNFDSFFTMAKVVDPNLNAKVIGSPQRGFEEAKSLLRQELLNRMTTQR